MQDITSSICTETTEGTEVQLEDKRDGNKYWVGKMKDGKCWMLQNLALGSTTGTTSLTSNDSNVTSSWTLPRAYTSVRIGELDIDGTEVWDFGKWVLATPLLAAECSGSNGIPGCIKIGFVNVSDSTKFEPTFTAQEMTWNGANATTDKTLVTVNCTSWSGSGENKTCTTGTYDAHYLIGNYYQWNAATAGTGAGITSQDASGSICPKGWKLPTRGTANVGSFGGLLSKYGISSKLSGTVNGTTYNIAGEPLRLVRSGFVYPGYNIGYAGRDGYYWLPTAGNDKYAHNFNFNDSSVNPQGYHERYHGFSVRCLAE